VLGGTTALTETPKSDTEVVLDHRPIDRGAIPFVIGQRRAIGSRGLLQPLRSGLTLAQLAQRIAEIVLCDRPAGGITLAVPATQCLPEGVDRRFQTWQDRVAVPQTDRRAQIRQGGEKPTRPGRMSIRFRHGVTEP
jgi:hypothetical protein